MVRLRDYRAEDQEALVTLWWDSWHSIRAGLRHPHPPSEWRARWAEEIAPRQRIVGAEDDGAVVGFAAADVGASVLTQVFVAPARKGQGVGHHLLAWAQRLMPDGFRLWTLVDNAASRAFYERRGLEAGDVKTNPVNGMSTIEYRWAPRVALILVDLQMGAFGGHGIPPAHEADGLLTNALALLWEARASDVPVVHIQHCARPGEVFAEDAPGWPISPVLRPEAGERVVRKRAGNAFENTELDEVLRAGGVTRVVVAGIQSEHCVAATCRGALRLGYGVRLAEDGHSTWPDGARPAGEIIAAENEALKRDGVVLGRTEDLVQWLRSGRARTGQS